jgi:tRNA-specific 2-thiouridylase
VAGRFDLPVADKPDSQDICFVPTGSYASVVSRLRPGAIDPGEIVHMDGRVLGRHDGIIHYTIGQRRGLGVATGEPLFVVRLEPETRRVIVGPREALLTRLVTLREVNWLGDGPLSEADGLDVQVKVRSTRPPAPATLRLRDGTVEVELADGEEGVSPGQACVFYDAARASRVLGGGWIARGTVA